jgi:hypothetical protein
MNRSSASRSSRGLLVAAGLAILLVGVIGTLCWISRRAAEPAMETTVALANSGSVGEAAVRPERVEDGMEQRIQQVESRCERMEQALTELKSQMASAASRVPAAGTPDADVTKQEVYGIVRELGSACLRNDVVALADKLAFAYRLSAENKKVLADAMLSGCNSLESQSLAGWWAARAINEPSPQMDEWNKAVDDVRHSLALDLQGIVDTGSTGSFANQLIDTVARHRSDHARLGTLIEK